MNVRWRISHIAFVGAFFIFKYILGADESQVSKISASIAIIGGADGPTAIYVTKKLAEHLLPAIAILMDLLLLGTRQAWSDPRSSVHSIRKSSLIT